MTDKDPEQTKGGRNKIGDALEKTTRKLQAIFDATVDGVLILDDKLRYTDANPAACKILARTKEEIVGQEIGAFSGDPGGTKERIQRILKQEVATGAADIRLSNGSILQLEYSVKKGILPGIHLVMIRDVSERKRLEQQLQQSQKMEAIGQLAGGVAHDFNNMLTVIRGYCELLQRQLPPTSEYRRYADTILNATDKATMTTQQLLAFSRRQVIQAREIQLNNVVQDMGKLLLRLIGEDVQLRISLDEQLGTVMADAGQMGQVLLNLAVNARDAMPNGGVILIETQNVKVDETYARTHLKVAPGDYVMLTFTDTGCGMSEEVLARIFEPFFTTKAAGKGTGLGLSTVYGIIEQASGAIYVYSEPGEGASFKLYFPRVDRVAESLTGDSGPAGQGLCAVVIEDDPEMGQMLKKFLQEDGFQVLSARSGGEALQLCQRHRGKLDLVVSDITMAGADGLDIQGYLGIEHPAAKMIFISGYPRKSLRERGMLPPEAAFLQKPFRWEDLRLLIEEVIGITTDPSHVQ
jgi:PAS domain S-box-containing protein